MEPAAVSASPSKVPSLRNHVASTLRFSIRELLLLTTTVAALLALFSVYYQRGQPYAESLLSTEFGSAKQIRAAAKPLSSQIIIINGGGGGGGTDGTRNKEYSYLVELPLQTRGRFMGQLRRDAQQMLTKEKCRLTGTGTRGNGNDLSGFSYCYEGDSKRGFLTVRRLDVSDDEMHLMIFLYEHEYRR